MHAPHVVRRPAPHHMSAAVMCTWASASSLVKARPTCGARAGAAPHERRGDAYLGLGAAVMRSTAASHVVRGPAPHHMSAAVMRTWASASRWVEALPPLVVRRLAVRAELRGRACERQPILLQGHEYDLAVRAEL